MNQPDQHCGPFRLTLTPSPRFRPGIRTLLLSSMLTGFALVPLLGLPAGAQTTEEDEAAKKEGPVSLGTIVLQAGSMPAPYAGGQVASGSAVGMLGNKDVLDTPYSTVAYTEDYVQNREAQDVGAVIGATDPSVYVPNKRNIFETYTIRGFSSSADDLTFGGLIGMAPNMRGTTEMAERVEVLKGPSTFLYGMPPGGSVGGAVALQPKRAGDEALTRLTSTYSSDSLYGLHADIGRRFGANKEWGVRVNAVSRDGDTAVDGEKHGMTMGSLALDWRGERARVSLDYYNIREKMKGINYFGVSAGAAVTVLPDPRDGTNTLAAPWAFNTNSTETVILRSEIDLSDSVTAWASYGHKSGGYDALITSSQITSNAGALSVSGVRSKRDGTQKSGEAGIRGSFITGQVGHDWVVTATSYDSSNTFKDRRFGVSSVTSIANPDWGLAPDLSAYDASGPTSILNLKLTSLGLSDTLKFMDDRLQVTIGLRYQTVKSSTIAISTAGVYSQTASYDSSKTSPAIAFVYKASEQLSFYGNYIEGLSAGQTAPATALNAGEVLPPYQTRQVEIGAKWDLGNLTTTVALFQIEKPSAYLDPVTLIYGVYGEQRNRGIELNAFGEVQDGLRLLGGISYTDAKVTQASTAATTGKTAAGTPAFMAKLGVEYDLPSLPGLTLSANVNHTGKRYANNTNTLSLPSFTVLDIGARYETEMRGNPLALRATVQNITDEAYWAGGNLAGGYGAPRTVLLSASVDF
ncbi:TonB-dependent receptor [Pseudogemmobacter bohemicus]|uniref:TonB-dependent receptor n=1 Tax=Pseudogemmobacter bohemicus TaxID=2250708 RepID=UPI001E487ECF|nr:TonB-dependent siderophore receptor [Pseudogemmobacter bohemicus]